jgi:hypothetical protein
VAVFADFGKQHCSLLLRVVPLSRDNPLPSNHANDDKWVWPLIWACNLYITKWALHISELIKATKGDCYGKRIWDLLKTEYDKSDPGCRLIIVLSGLRK